MEKETKEEFEKDAAHIAAALATRPLTEEETKAGIAYARGLHDGQEIERAKKESA